MAYRLAIDIGASSGRHILGHIEKGRMVLEEIYRFDNIQQYKNGHDCWNLQALWQHILAGLRLCKEQGKLPSTMGIDTWAVDFVLVDKQGNPLGEAVAYRDSRTQGMKDRLQQVYGLDFSSHYQRTGIQYQPFNTVYQLAAVAQQQPQQLENAHWLLMIPEYFHYRLTGIMMNEYTNGTSTALVNAHTKTWDDQIIEQLGLPRGIFGKLEMPGTVVGHFTPEVQREVGFDCTVVLPATHDTASAFLAVPAKDGNGVSLSSGTWSLLGVERNSPITTPESCAANFTNEGGYNRGVRYLKNIMGLWMIQSVRRQWNGVAYVEGKESCFHGNRQWSYSQLEEEAKKHPHFASRVEVNHPRFLAPSDMVAEIQQACRESNQPVPQGVGQVMACIYHSLAESYAAAIDQLQSLTGDHYNAIYVVGGGSQSHYLNALTAKATRLPVFAGPVEATALGNLMIQFVGAGEFDSIQAARAAIPESFEVTEVQP